MAATSTDMLAGTPRISESSLDKLFSIRQQEKEKRDQNIPLWKDIASNSNMALDDWDEDDDSGSAPPDFRSLYDNTMAKSSIKLSEAIESYAFGRSSPWARIATEDPKLMESTEVKKWLQLMEVHCNRQRDKSGWYAEARVFVRIGIDFSTSVMMRMNNIARGLPSYQTLSLNKVVFMDNEFGEPDVLFRDAWLSPFDAASMFTLDALPRQIQEAYAKGQTARFKFIQMIFPLSKFDLDIERRQSKGMPIYSLYVADIDRKRGIREGGYWTPCWWAWRFSRNTDGSVWGTDSPGYLEIGNSKQLQSMRKDFHRGVQQKFRPALKATEGIENRIRLEPNGITPLGPGQDFTAALTIGDTQGVMIDLEGIAKGIRDSYYMNLFQLLTQNIERMKTATEVDAIRGEQAAMAASFYGRLSTEFLERDQEDLVQCEMSSGRAPPAPREIRGRVLKIDQVSPLAIMQKKYLLLDGTKQFMAEVYALAQMFPEGPDNLKPNEYIRLLAETYHIDQRVIRDLVEVKKIQVAKAQAKQEMVAQQQEAMMLEAKAKAYGAGSQAPQAGSPAAQAMPVMAGGR